MPGAACLCATNATLKRMSLDDLKELVEAPLDDDIPCLELDETVRVTVGDREVCQHLLEQYGIADSIKVQELDKNKRNEIIISCLNLGVGLRQPTHEVSAEPNSFELCLTRRRKTRG